MLKEATGIADTIEAAKNIALKNLNAPIEADVKIEILEQPKKKILGIFGGSSAKVRAYFDDGKKEPKPETKKKPEVKKEVAETKPKTAEKTEPKQDDKKGLNKKPDVKKPENKKPENTKTQPAVDLSRAEAKETAATDYLKSILVGMGFTDVGVTVKEAGEDLYFDIACTEDYGNIIGKRGETLDALQYLTRLFVNRSNDDGKRVSLNIGDYRERRAQTLKALAARQAARALKIGRSCSLEPMNPYERRIIHTAIQGIDGVTSHSVGEGDSRRVVIVPENAKGGFKGGRGRNNYGRREKRAPYVPEASEEPREQKVDAVSSSRYGKIEPKKSAEEVISGEAE